MIVFQLPLLRQWFQVDSHCYILGVSLATGRSVDARLMRASAGLTALSPYRSITSYRARWAKGGGMHSVRYIRRYYYAVGSRPGISLSCRHYLTIFSTISILKRWRLKMRRRVYYAIDVGRFMFLFCWLQVEVSSRRVGGDCRDIRRACWPGQ